MPAGDRLILRGQDLNGADFSGRDFLQISVAGSRLTGCQFVRVKSRDAGFGAGRTMSHYIECRFDGARLTMGPGGMARFERCSFRDVDLRDWFCVPEGIELVDCVFTGRLRKAVFNGTVYEEDREWVGRSRNEFCGNDFAGMELIDVAFRTGIDLSLQRLPTGPSYLYLPDAAAAVQRARAKVVRWNDLAMRKEAMIDIGLWEETIQNGQRQLLLRKDDYARPRQAMDALFGLLVAQQDSLALPHARGQLNRHSIGLCTRRLGRS